MEIPYVGFSNATLEKQKKAAVGDTVACPRCGNLHALEPCDDGSTVVMFYRCGGKSYLGAVGGRVVVNTKADISGEL